DDQRLLAMLVEALDAASAVPREFIEAGKEVYLPPDLDAELAKLIRDSQHELALTRAETAPLRTLTFASDSIVIELEVSSNGMQGQLVPPCRGRIEIEVRDGTVTSASSDETGYFAIPSVPKGRFRLRCRTDSENDTFTTWITI